MLFLPLSLALWVLKGVALGSGAGVWQRRLGLPDEPKQGAGLILHTATEAARLARPQVSAGAMIELEIVGSKGKKLQEEVLLSG